MVWRCSSCKLYMWRLVAGQLVQGVWVYAQVLVYVQGWENAQSPAYVQELEDIHGQLYVHKNEKMKMRDF